MIQPTRAATLLTLLTLAIAALSLTACRAGAPRDAQADARLNDPLWRSELREQAIETLTRAAVSGDPLLRANAIEGLQHTPARLEPLLAAALDDENLGVRYAAAMVAGRLQLRGFAPALRTRLNDEAGPVRAAATYALYNMVELTDPTPLASMLFAGGARDRAHAAFILGEMGDASAIPLLVEGAARDVPRATNSEIRLLRLQIAEALVKLGRDDALEAIRAALYPSRPEELEATALAVQIIGQVGDRRAIDQLIYIAEPARKRPSGQTDYIDPDTQQMPAEVRLAAAASLAQLGMPRGAFIADEYRTHESPVLRGQAAFVYGQIGDPANLLRLKEMLEDVSPLVRVSAASAVLRITEGRATTPAASP